MFKQNKKSILFYFLICCFFNSWSQQIEPMKYWWVYGNSTSNVLNTSGNGFAQLSSPLASSPASQVGAANSIYDNNGSLVFFVSNGKIISPNGTVLATIFADLYLTSEISIVPDPNNDQCNPIDKYYVFFHGNSSTGGYGCGLYYSVVVKNKTNGSLSVPTNNFRVTPVPQYAPPVHGSIAVGKLKDGKRFLYYLGGYNDVYGFLYKVTISSSGISAPQLLLSNNTSFLYNSLELELSNDGTMLAWGASHASHTTIYLYIIRLNTLGDYGGIVKTYPLPTPPFHYQRWDAVKGIEFNSSGTKLFFAHGISNSNPQPGFLKGVFVMDLNTDVYTLIPNTVDLGSSQLEMGKDGKLYAGHCREIVGTPFSINNSYFGVIDPVALVRLSQNINIPPQGRDLPIYTETDRFGDALLPDQIDGENYDLLIKSFSTITYDITSNYSVNAVSNWNNITNPFNNKKSIVVNGTIEINSGATLNITDLNFQFYSNGKIVVRNGGKLIVNGCLLEAVNCQLMWPGITIENGGTIQVNGSIANVKSTIKDALSAITVSGLLTRTVLQNCNFEKNENDIILNNCPISKIPISATGPETSISNCKFDHSMPLRDQSKGITYDWGGNLKRGITGISLRNCTSGEIFIGPNNLFVNGQYGISSNNSEYRIKSCSFNEIKGYGRVVVISNPLTTITQNLPATAILSQNTILAGNRALTNEIATNTFYKCQRCINHNGNSAFIVKDKNIFVNSFERAIEVKGCKTKSKIEIVDNTFDFCNWESIFLSDNVIRNTIASDNLIVSINLNSIRNHPFANGIVIQENTLINNPTPYQTFEIQDNKIGITPNQLIGQGIILRNLNLTNNKIKIGKVFKNKIYYSTSLNANYNGLYVENCLSTKIEENTIEGNNNNSNQNSGISIINSQNSLIYKNTISAGNGILALQNMLGSDYFCNNLLNNRNGFNLRNGHLLRNSGVNHGICNTETRYNNFVNSRNTDINRTSNVFQNTNRWVWAPGPKPSFLIEGGGSSSLIVCDAQNGCINGFPVAIASTDSILNSGSINQTYPSAYIWSLEYDRHKNLFNFKKSDLVDNNFKKLLDIQNCIDSLNYLDGINLLNNFISTNPIEQDFKRIFQILININDSNFSQLNAEDSNFVTQLALSDPFLVGPQVFYSRSLVKRFYNIDKFIDIPVLNDINGNIQSNCTPMSISTKQINLLSENNTVIADSAYIDPDNFEYSFFGERLLNIAINDFVTVSCSDSDYILPPHRMFFDWTSSPSDLNSIFIQCNEVEKLNAPVFSNNEVFISPNPSNGFVKINGLPKDKLINFNLFNSIGEKVFEKSVSNEQIDLTSLLDGFYICILVDISSNELLTKTKLIIKH